MADTQDYPLIRELEEAAWNELDRQYLEDNTPYVDVHNSLIDGGVNLFKVVEAVMDAYWEVEGR